MFLMICFPPGPKTAQSKPENTYNRSYNDGCHKVLNKGHIPTGSQV